MVNYTKSMYVLFDFLDDDVEELMLKLLLMCCFEKFQVMMDEETEKTKRNA